MLHVTTIEWVVKLGDPNRLWVGQEGLVDRVGERGAHVYSYRRNLPAFAYVMGLAHTIRAD